MSIEHILFVALAFFASFISAVIGFGTALVVVALGAHILPIKQVISLAGVLFVTLTLSKAILFRHNVDWKLVILLSLSSFPFAFLGGALLEYVPAEILKRLLGVLVLAYLILTTFELLPTFTLGRVGLSIGSALYGFLSGLLGSGNVVIAMMFRELNITKEAFVGAMAATAVLANIAKLLAYINAGMYTHEMKAPIISLVITGLIVVFLGRHIVRKITVYQFELGFKVVLAVSAVSLLI